MGLAYDLDALDLPGLDWFSIFTLASAGIRAPSYGGYSDRWDGINMPKGIDEFDCIIRDVKQVNGMIAICGSYRALSTEDPWAGPGGPMEDALFYDGFVAFQRGFTWTFPLGSNASAFKFDPFKASAANDAESWLVIPMRMPFEVNSGSAFDDETIGLYSLEPLKSVEPFSGEVGPQVTAGAPLVQLATCGFSAIDPTEYPLPDDGGVPAGQDYVGNMYIIPVIVGAIPLTNGYWIEIDPDKQFSAQITWNIEGDGAGSGGIYNTIDNARFGLQTEVGQPGINRLSLDLLASDSTYNAFNVQYSIEYPDSKLSGRQRYPRRFLSMAATSLVLPAGEPFDLDAFGPIILGGDCTYAPAGTVTGTFPMVAYNYWADNTNRLTDTGFLSGPMPLLTCFTDENTQVEGGISGPATYTLDGAYFRYVIPTTDFLTGAPAPNTPFEPTLLLAENVAHGADKSAEIYIISGVAKASAFTIADGQLPGIGPDPTQPGTPVVGATCITPYAVSGGAWETATGITLPQRWTGFANQMRTFTRDEEFASRNDNNTGSLEFATVADENGTLVGVVDNYPRFGFTTTQTLYEPPGTPDNQVLLLMGVTISGATYTPHLLAFDNGTVSTKPTAEPAGGGPVTALPPYEMQNTGYVKDYGITVQNQILESSTNSYPVSASWDNDRDQWLILYNRDSPSSYALISARSDFTQFIDQSPNIKIFTGIMGSEDAGAGGAAFYGIPFGSGYELFPAGIYTARLMTNELDGIVIGGIFEDLSDPDKMSALRTVRRNFTQPERYSNFTVVRGTTGRTARVWVDYVLYDGVDALVATKLSELGLRVTPENVEWFKGRILRSAGVDELDVKTEEIEQWMEAQRKEYTDMLRSKERAGRLRKRKRQVSAYREGVEGALADANKSSVDTRALDPEKMDDLLKDIGMPDDGYSSDRKRS